MIIPEHGGNTAGGILLLLQLEATSQLPSPVNVYKGKVIFTISLLLTATIGVEQLLMLVRTHLMVSPLIKEAVV